MDLVRIGRLQRPHGLRGEVVLDGASLTGEELLSIGLFVWKGAGRTERALTLQGVRGGGDRLLLRFEGVTDRDQASDLGLGELFVERSRLPDAGPGQAYTFQLVGLRVVEEDGRELGTVAEVMRTGAHPVYVVRGRRELLIPAVEPIIKRVDLEAGVMVVALPRGLEEL